MSNVEKQGSKSITDLYLDLNESQKNKLGDLKAYLEEDQFYAAIDALEKRKISLPEDTKEILEGLKEILLAVINNEEVEPLTLSGVLSNINLLSPHGTNLEKASMPNEMIVTANEVRKGIKEKMLPAIEAMSAKYLEALQGLSATITSFGNIEAGLLEDDFNQRSDVQGMAIEMEMFLAPVESFMSEIASGEEYKKLMPELEGHVQYEEVQERIIIAQNILQQLKDIQAESHVDVDSIQANADIINKLGAMDNNSMQSFLEQIGDEEKGRVYALQNMLEQIKTADKQTVNRLFNANKVLVIAMAVYVGAHRTHAFDKNINLEAAKEGLKSAVNEFNDLLSVAKQKLPIKLKEFDAYDYETVLSHLHSMKLGFRIGAIQLPFNADEVQKKIDARKIALDAADVESKALIESVAKYFEGGMTMVDGVVRKELASGEEDQ